MLSVVEIVSKIKVEKRLWDGVIMVVIGDIDKNSFCEIGEI